jgi:hypothetical protein
MFGLNHDEKFILQHVFEYGFIDDHDGKEVNPTSVGIWTNYNETHIIPIYKGTFCCNPLYVSKDDAITPIHLSTWSCGGTVIGGNVDRFNHEMSPNNGDGLHTYENIIVITKEGWEKIKGRKMFIAPAKAK